MEEQPKPHLSDRRAALKKIAAGAGGVVSLPILGQIVVTPGLARATCCHPAGPDAGPPDPEWKPIFLDGHQNDMVVALTDLIIPQTHTPGAKAALVNQFIDLVLNEEPESKQRSFIEGLAWTDARSQSLYGKPFTGLTPEQQTDLLTPLADPSNKKPEDQPGVRFFIELKDYTIYGYYTSKIGMEQEMEYDGGDYHTEFPGACTHPDHQT